MRLLPFSRRGNRSESQPKTRQLWGKEFATVSEGLSEEQVVGFVNELLAKQREQEQRQETSDPFPNLLSKRILAEAERDATALRLKAKNEAAAEASQIVAAAKLESQKILNSTKKDAIASAEQEAQSILDTAGQKAHLAETHALQMAHLFLIRAREEIQSMIASETKEVYNRLLTSVQDVLTTAQSVENDWTTKRIAPRWGQPAELKEYQATLLDSLMVGGLNLEALSQENSEEASPLSLEGTDTEVETETEQSEGDDATDEESAPSATLEAEQETQPVDQVEDEEAAPSEVEAPVAEAAPIAEAADEEEATEPVSTEDEAPDTIEVTSSQMEETAETEAASQEEGDPPAEEGAAAPEEGLETTIDASGNEVTLDGGERVYTGEVELVLTPPISAIRVTGLYSHLQSIDELKVVRTSGSWDKGTVVTVALERPLALIKTLSDIPDIEVVPGTVGTKGPGERGRAVQRLNVTFVTEDTEE